VLVRTAQENVAQAELLLPASLLLRLLPLLLLPLLLLPLLLLPLLLLPLLLLPLLLRLLAGRGRVKRPEPTTAHQPSHMRPQRQRSMQAQPHLRRG
jgi:hypothetical protein